MTMDKIIANSNNRVVVPTNISSEDRNRLRNVAYYGRASTEHEAQLSALANQMQWYDDQTKYHSNWKVVHKYIDEGITGTQAKKRPAFMQMLADAREHKFDLIVTREVCRFARNTVDTLVVTRELKNIGIEVYFVNDNIWTMDGDGELRLSLMATLAQEESRKTSERVRAGQKISRDKGVLYGNGNILGYDRVGGTYVINPDQAQTVRLIYELYLKGYGFMKIVNELTRLQRKDSYGLVRWECSKISRILHNATYMGYKCYLKSYRNNYLDIVRKHMEMNIAHPVMEGNGRAIRIWLDLILKKNLHTCTDWSRINKREYLGAMKESPVDSTHIFELIKNAQTSQIDDRKIFMKGIDYSYYYEQIDE